MGCIGEGGGSVGEKYRGREAVESCEQKSPRPYHKGYAKEASMLAYSGWNVENLTFLHMGIDQSVI